MIPYGQAVTILVTAPVGYAMRNSGNGREVEVVDRQDRYYCKDAQKGIFYWTRSVDDAYKWLDGTLFQGMDSSSVVGDKINPFFRPIRGWKGGHPI